MKSVKMLGLALVAALASMAFVGASSALATGSTAFCNNESLPCNNVFTGHIEAVSSNVVMDFSGVEITCTKSTVLGEALGLANPQITHVSELTIGSCDGTVTIFDKTGLITALKVKKNEAEGETSGFAVLVEKFGAHCVFGGLAKGVKLVSAPDRLFEIIANEVELKKLAGGFFCSGTSKLTATYKVVLPHTIFISS